jgi:hypothetical protein
MLWSTIRSMVGARSQYQNVGNRMVGDRYGDDVRGERRRQRRERRESVPGVKERVIGGRVVEMPADCVVFVMSSIGPMRVVFGPSVAANGVVALISMVAILRHQCWGGAPRVRCRAEDHELVLIVSRWWGGGGGGPVGGDGWYPPPIAEIPMLAILGRRD